jgi:hypothetical protein
MLALSAFSDGDVVLTIIAAVLGLLCFFPVLPAVSVLIGLAQETRSPDRPDRQLHAELRAGAVAVAEGLGHRSWRKFTWTQNYFVMTNLYYSYAVGEQRFALPSRTAYNACLSGMLCRAHYTPRSRRLLSVEVTGFPALTSRVWQVGAGDEGGEAEQVAAAASHGKEGAPSQ